VLNLAD